MPRTVIGLDIGGANLKAAHSRGGARLTPFELWKNPARLPVALRVLLEQLPAGDLLAVTMTGELCDCFETKRQGVHAILDAVQEAAGRTPVRVWQTDGSLVDLNVALRTPLLAAASNWLALATFAARHAPRGAAILIDIGSTTTDLIPLHNGRPIPRGRTDAERLVSGELVYMGVRRTPVCALLQDGVAAELFATMLDVHLLLGQVNQDPLERGTADGQPATRSHAHARLARMLGADSETCDREQTHELARRASHEQVVRIRRAAEQVRTRLPDVLETVIVAGSGEFLARKILDGWADFAPCRVVSLAKELGPAVSEAACAHAVAMLAAEQSEE